LESEGSRVKPRFCGIASLEPIPPAGIMKTAKSVPIAACIVL
jgi:hypothetical protein